MDVYRSSRHRNRVMEEDAGSVAVKMEKEEADSDWCQSAAETTSSEVSPDDSGVTVKTTVAPDDSGVTVKTTVSPDDSGVTVKTTVSPDDSDVTMKTTVSPDDSGVTVKTEPARWIVCGDVLLLEDAGGSMERGTH